LNLRVQGLGFRVYEFKVQVQGLGVRAEGLDCRV